MNRGFSRSMAIRRVALCVVAVTAVGCSSPILVSPVGLDVDAGTPRLDAGTWVSDGGMPIDVMVGCVAPAIVCGGLCTDTTMDSANCGACGHACPAATGQTCQAGTCMCPTGQSLCAGTCLSTAMDDANCGACGHACRAGSHCTAGVCPPSAIEHVVLIVQENHTFDSYFGRYCTAASGTDPGCTEGRGCCEAAPATDPRGTRPAPLTDNDNYTWDHDHSAACELCEINNGRMDRFTGGILASCPIDVSTISPISRACSSPSNFEVATDSALMNTYWSLADANALADRYFQPIAGGTSSNDMYLAGARYEFVDNAMTPAARGAGCVLGSPTVGMALPGRRTIADLLVDAGVSFGVYADGYLDAYNAWPGCPAPGGICHERFLTMACRYDPSDIPFQYYPRFADNQATMHDLTQFYTDVASDTLPAFAYVKFRSSANEHPSVSTISDGENNVNSILTPLMSSPRYANNTLVLITWDEGGGFYDHIAPPTAIEHHPDGSDVPYGTRVPLLAIGRFARHGHISHVQMEHSSIVRFLEFNFLGTTGDLAARDRDVNNIGSLLDPTTTGIVIPE